MVNDRDGSPIPVFTNVNLSGNVATYGGGLYIYAGTPTVTYGNAYDNSPDTYGAFTDPTGTAGNIAVDPEFVDTSSADPADWDLQLSDSSPLIDAGDPSILDPDLSTSDIGAYGGPGADAWE